MFPFDRELDEGPAGAEEYHDSVAEESDQRGEQPVLGLICALLLVVLLQLLERFEAEPAVLEEGPEPDQQQPAAERTAGHAEVRLEGKGGFLMLQNYSNVQSSTTYKDLKLEETSDDKEKNKEELIEKPLDPKCTFIPSYEDFISNQIIEPFINLKVIESEIALFLIESMIDDEKQIYNTVQITKDLQMQIQAEFGFQSIMYAHILKYPVMSHYPQAQRPNPD